MADPSPIMSCFTPLRSILQCDTKLCNFDNHAKRRVIHTIGAVTISSRVMWKAHLGAMVVGGQERHVRNVQVP